MMAVDPYGELHILTVDRLTILPPHMWQSCSHTFKHSCIDVIALYKCRIYPCQEGYKDHLEHAAPEIRIS